MVIKPDEAGLSSERLERVTRHLERRYIEPGKLSGCQVLVARKGHVAYFRSFGAMDLEREKPMRDDTIFRIYQLMPSNTFNFRGQLQSLVYPAIID